MLLMKCFWLTFLLQKVSSEGSVEIKGYDFQGPLLSTAEQRLHNDLFHDRVRTVFPVDHAELNLKFGITLDSVTDFEAANEAIIINAYIRQSWTNSFLTWDPASYDNITKINVYPDLTWKPDIYAYANIEEGLSYMGILDTFKTHIIVSHDGSHFWLAPVTFRFGCTMNVKDFPFDTQTCPLRFGSYTYDSTRLMVHPEPVDLTNYAESSEWILISMKEVQDLTYYADLKQPYCDVEYTIILKRKPLYFLLNLVAPNLIIGFLTVVVFVIPTQAGEKTGYVITLLLALSWFMVSSGEIMPSSSEAIPLFQYFLGSTLTMMAILSICLCYSIACHFADPNVTKLPIWMRKIIFENLASYFNINTKRKYPKWRINLNALKEKNYEKPTFIDDHNTSENNAQEDTEEDLPGRLWSSDSSKETSFMSEEYLKNLTGILGSRCIHDTHCQINTILKSYEDEDDSNWLQTEWHIVAMTLDRLFLYLFTFVLLTTLFSCAVHIVKVY